MSKYIDLIEALPANDKITIESYIKKYGAKDHFVGVNEWLQNWSHANQKLYKLLGNSFIKEFSFEYEKTLDMLSKEIYNLVEDENFEGYNFFTNYHKFITYLTANKEKYELTDSDILTFKKTIFASNFITNKFDYSLKYKKPGGRKILQIQQGSKIFRVLNQIMNYFKNDFEFDKASFEEFRKKHAIIFSEKVIKGTVAISIHPIDFLTMSDNESNWTSCMSWKSEGCYHVGTIEMMNSNNVVCCYLKNTSSPFVFDTETIDPETGEILGAWNNKRWRSLFYVTKDIIMSGKPYPYTSLDLTKSLLNHIRDLAKENLNWEYKFGPERYKDMAHINSLYRMDKQRTWIQTKSYVKHNILWDTRGMYNDMLNDPGTCYMCYRNKVDHTKIISVSGKSNCLCCNEDILNYDEYATDYNERYPETGNVICSDCLYRYFQCAYCGRKDGKIKIFATKNGNICLDCLEKYIRRCPDCGKPFYCDTRIEDVFWNNYLYDELEEDPTFLQKIKKKFADNDIRCYYTYSLEKQEVAEKELNCLNDIKENKACAYLSIEPLYCCKKCREKAEEQLILDASYSFEKPRYWSKKKNINYICNPKAGAKYRYYNLQNVSLEEIQQENVIV